MPFTKELIVGTVFVLAGLVLVTAVMATNPDNRSVKQELLVTFDTVGGLEEGADVFVSGVRVGSVGKIELTKGRVRVDLAFRQKVVLYKDLTVKIDVPLALAKTSVIITPGTPAKGLLERSNIDGVNPPSLMGLVDEIQSVVGDFKKGKGALHMLIKDKTVASDLRATVNNIKAFTARLQTAEGTVRMLLDDKEVADNLRATITSLKQFTADLEAADGTLHMLMKDKTLAADVRATVKNIRELTDKARDGKGLFHTLMTDEKVAEQFRTLVANVNDASANISSLTAGVKEGKGTIGLLFTDDTLFTQASDLFKRVNGMIEDAREQAPITSFTSVLFGAIR